MYTWKISAIWSSSFHTGSIAMIFVLLISVGDFERIWSLHIQLWVKCIFRHVHSVTATVQAFDFFNLILFLNTGSPRWPVVSASAADDPARAGERWRGVWPESSQLALFRFLRQLRDQPEVRAGPTSARLEVERGHVRLHAVHAARLAWAANAAGHRRPA